MCLPPTLPPVLFPQPTARMNLGMTAMKHNASPTPDDSSRAGEGPERKQPKRQTESAQDMVHEVEIANLGDSCGDGSFMMSRVHERQKQEPYFTDTETGVPRNRHTD